MTKFRASALGVVAACLLPVLGLAAGDAACFDEIEQNYQWDDGGFHWSAMPDRCPGSPQPASPSERKWGGSVQIRANGADAMVIEETYAWTPPRQGDITGCPHFVKTVTRKTRIAKSGTLYETKQVDSEAPQHSQRPLGPNEMISISNVQQAPRPGDRSVELLGTDTVAGQPCRRVASKPIVAGAGTYTMCIFVAPPTCRAAHYLQPLELTTKAPDGTVIWRGHTTSLRYGGGGKLVPSNSIRAP